MSPETYHVDVVIVGFRDPALVERAISSVARSCGPVVEAIVVDNSAGRPQCPPGCSSTKYVSVGTNLGYGAACNIGLSMATAEWVAFANQDVEVDADTIGLLIEAVEDHERQQGRTAVVGPSLMTPAGVRADGGHNMPTPFRQVVELLVGERLAGMRDQAVSFGDPVEAGWLPAAFILGRRRVLCGVGGFDPRYFMYVEDVDLFSRLADKEVDCLWVPRAMACHAGGRRPISGSLYGRALLNWGKYFRARYGRRTELIILAAGMVGALMRWLYWSIRSSIGHADDAEAYVAMFSGSAAMLLRDLRPSEGWGMMSWPWLTAGSAEARGSPGISGPFSWCRPQGASRDRGEQVGIVPLADDLAGMPQGVIDEND